MGVPACHKQLATLIERHCIHIEIVIAPDCIFDSQSETVEKLHYTVGAENRNMEIILQQQHSSDAAAAYK